MGNGERFGIRQFNIIDSLGNIGDIIAIVSLWSLRDRVYGERQWFIISTRVIREKIENDWFPALSGLMWEENPYC